MRPFKSTVGIPFRLSVDLGKLRSVSGNFSSGLGIIHDTFNVPVVREFLRLFHSNNGTGEHSTPLLTVAVSDKQIECWLASHGSHCLELSSYCGLDPAPRSVRKFDGDAVKVQGIASSRTGGSRSLKVLPGSRCTSTASPVCSPHPANSCMPRGTQG